MPKSIIRLAEKNGLERLWKIDRSKRMAADNHLSPEVDLLDQFLGGPMTLPLALSIFPDWERARKAFRFLAADHSVEFVDNDDGLRVLHPWEIRRLLDSSIASEADWRRIQLRLTDAGHAKWLKDSEGFFSRLFSR